MNTLSKNVSGSTAAAEFVRPAQYRLNRSLLVWTLVVLAVVGAGSYGLRDVFTKRNATTLLREAERAEAANNLPRAERFYSQFLQLTKGDSSDPGVAELRADTLLKLAQVISRSDANAVNVPRIARHLEESLRLNSELIASRRLLIPLLVQMRRYSDALQHIEQLEQQIESQADHDTEAAELAFRAGRCHELLEDRPKAQRRYCESIAKLPAQLSSYLGLARVWSTDQSGVEFVSETGPQWPELETLQSSRTRGTPAPTLSAIVLLLNRMVEANPGLESEAARASTLLSLSLETDAPSVGPDVAAEKATKVLADADAGNSKDGVLAKEECYHAVVPALADRDEDGRITPEELTQRWLEGDRDARRREAEKVLSRLEQSPSVEAATPLNHLLQTLVSARLNEAATGSALPAKDRQAMIDDARRLIDQSMKYNADDPQVQSLLAEIELQSTQTALTLDKQREYLRKAETALRRGLELNAHLLGNVVTDEWKTPFGAENPAVTELRLQYKLGQVLVSLVETEPNSSGKELAEAGEIAKKVRQAVADPLIALLLEFRIAMNDPDASRSSRLELAKLLTRSVGNPNTLSREAAAMLGRTYTQFGDSGAALEIYRRQLRAEPLWVVGRVNLAEVLVSLGRTQEAIDQYESVAGFPGVAERLATILLVQQAQRPPETRDFGRLRSVLKLVEATTSDSIAPLVLGAELIGLEAVTLRQIGHIRRSQQSEKQAEQLETQSQQMLTAAEKQLRDAVQSQPKAVPLWTALASLLMRRDDLLPEERFDLVMKVVADAKTSVGDHASLALVELAAAAQKERKSELPVVQRLAGNLEVFPDEDKLRLVIRIGQVLSSYGEVTEARNRLYKYSQDMPNNIDLQRITNQALLRDLRPGNSTWEDQWSENLKRIEALEGTTQGYVLLAQTLRLMQEPGTDAEKQQRLVQARANLAILRKTRPFLPAVPRTLGLLEEMVAQTFSTPANLGAAATAYREAMQLGDRSRSVVERLVRVLHQQDFEHKLEVIAKANKEGREPNPADLKSPYLEDAQRLMDTLAAEEANAVSGDLARLAWRVADGLKDWERGDDIAEKLGAESPDDATQYEVARRKASRGQRSPEIESKLVKQAREIDPKNPDAWMYLVVYHAQDHNWDAVKSTIEEAESHLTEPTAKNAVALAQFWEKLSRSVPSVPQYAAAMTKHYEVIEKKFADDNLALLQVADFYLRDRRFDDARKVLKRLDDPTRDLPDDVRERVRFQLAALENPSDKYQDIRNAIKTLEKYTSADGTLSPANLRRQIQTLQRNPNPEFLSLQADRYTRLQTLGKGQLPDDERFAFAMVLDRLGRWEEAQTQFRKCLESPQVPVRIRVEYCQAMLRRLAAKSDSDPAQLLNTLDNELQVLDRIEPKSWRTSVVKARLLAVRQQASEATSLLSSLVKSRLDDSSENRFKYLFQEEPFGEVLQEWINTASPKEQQEIAAEFEPMRVLMQENKLSEVALALAKSPIAPLLDRFVIRKSLEVANLVTTWDAAAAESMMVQCLKKNENSDAPRELARHYVNAKRAAEAMKICEEHWDRITPAGVAYIMSLLAQSLGDVPLPQLREWRERLVTASKSMTPTEQGLLNLHLGNFDNATGHFEEAVAEYAIANKSTSRRFDAQNNYAFLSARLGKNLPEASEAIETALATVGSRTELLDTKATVLIAQGKVDEAKELLEQEVSQKRADATMLFRLAECYHRQNDPNRSRMYLKRATDKGLDIKQLHPLDQGVLKELESAQK